MTVDYRIIINHFEEELSDWMSRNLNERVKKSAKDNRFLHDLDPRLAQAFLIHFKMSKLIDTN